MCVVPDSEMQEKEMVGTKEMPLQYKYCLIFNHLFLTLQVGEADFYNHSNRQSRHLWDYSFLRKTKEKKLEAQR